MYAEYRVDVCVGASFSNVLILDSVPVSDFKCSKCAKLGHKGETPDDRFTKNRQHQVICNSSHVRHHYSCPVL